MATNRKRTPRSRKQTGLTPAQHFFVYGEEIGKVNCFEMLTLECPRTELEKTKVEEMLKLRKKFLSTAKTVPDYRWLDKFISERRMPTCGQDSDNPGKA